MTKKIIRIGTRGSPLALAQTEMVRAALAQVRPDIETQTVIIKTSGDWITAQGERPLDPERGGKALFAKELEEALLAGLIDAAVHSMKDMDSHLPQGLIIGAVLPREDARDAVIVKAADRSVGNISELPKGAAVGTCSLRRQGMLLALRPDLKVTGLRGNIGTRLEKLEAGSMDAILLATAGLNRLNLAKNINFKIPVDQIVPCAGQGIIGVEIKENSLENVSIFSQINCPETFIQLSCERTVLAELGGSCRTPVGVHATLERNKLKIHARLISPDGKNSYEERGKKILETTIAELRNQTGRSFKERYYLEAQALGREVGRRLRHVAPKELL